MKTKILNKLLAGVIVAIMMIALFPSQIEASTIRLDREGDIALMQNWNGSAWVDMNGRKYYVVGTNPKQIAYCIEHTQIGPAGEAYPAANAWSAYAAATQTALKSILANGYPFTRSFTVGGTTYTLTADQARYATSQAIRFWMGQRGSYNYSWDVISHWSDAQLRSYAANGTIPGKVRAKSGQVRTLQMAVELYINARNGNASITHSISFSPSSLTLTESGEQLRASTTITLENASLGYRLVNLPSGVSVSGYTGRSGDTLTFTASPSLATSLSSFTVRAESFDDRILASNFTLLREPDPARQRMVYVNLATPQNTSSFTTNRLAATRNISVNVPTDLSVTAVSTGTYEPGQTISVTATVRNISQRASGSYQLRIAGPSGYATQTVSQSSLSAGSQRNHTFTYTAPTNLHQTTPTFTVTVDPNNNLNEATRTNNARSAAATIRAIQDVEVVNISTNKSTYLPGENVNVTATVRNNSSRSTGAFHVRLRLDSTTLNEPSWTSMSGNTTRTYSFSFAAPSVTGTTNYTLTLLADSQNVLTELNKANNSRSTTITVQGRPDLEITGLSTDKTTYNPGETITVTTNVRNKGSSPSSSSMLTLKRGDNNLATRNIPVLNAGSSWGTQTFTFTAPATIATTSYAVNVSIPSTQSPTGVTSRTVNIAVRGQPDLEITSLSTDRSAYNPGDIVVATTNVRNKGFSSSSGYTITIRQGSVIVATRSMPGLAAGASSGNQMFSFAAPNTMIDEDFMIEASIPTGQSPTGTTRRTTSISVLGLPDLEVISSTAQDYFTDKDVIISALIRNNRTRLVADAEVQLTFAGHELIENIPVPGNSSNLAVFRVRTPDQPGQYSLTIIVDPHNDIAESNEDNNLLSRVITVNPPLLQPIPDPDHPSLHQYFLNHGKKLPDLALPAGQRRHAWQELRFGNGSYVTRDFWMQLDTVFGINPDPRVAISGKPDLIESGFGIESNAEMVITTNYDRPDKLVGPQMVYLFYPETAYGKTPFANYGDSLEILSGAKAAHSSLWQYSVSPFSLTGSRLHYTPLWTPDGSYDVMAQSFYAWSPVGQMYDFTSDSVTIEGDMYDRVTVVRR